MILTVLPILTRVWSNERVSGSRVVDILRVAADRRSGVRDIVAVEEPLEVRVNGVPFAVTMRTPGADRELATGFLLSEDVIHHGDEVNSIRVSRGGHRRSGRQHVERTVTGDAAHRLQVRLGERRQVMMTSACGLCGRRTIDSLRSRVPFVDGRWTVSPEVIAGCPADGCEGQSVFEATGGLHAAGSVLARRRDAVIAEDVGRHNAVDKVVGAPARRARCHSTAAMLFISGRASFELVQKALLAGVPLVAAVSAPRASRLSLPKRRASRCAGSFVERRSTSTRMRNGSRRQGATRLRLGRLGAKAGRLGGWARSATCDGCDG